MDLVWGYSPSSLGRTVAEEWVAANDCSVVDQIVIAESTVVVRSHHTGRRPAVTIQLNRQWDLGADLAEAVETLRRELTPRQARSLRRLR